MKNVTQQDLDEAPEFMSPEAVMAEIKATLEHSEKAGATCDCTADGYCALAAVSLVMALGPIF
ncbi:MAG: hypothetical protein VCB25_05785, partial [Myxococcota bacterium]